MSLRLVPMLILTLWSAASEANGERMERARSTPSLGSGCSEGCEECSEVNGCLKCDAKHLLLLQRDFMSHKGTCVQSCPVGYYLEKDIYRKHNILKCHSCSRNCDTCYDKMYCSRCTPPFLEYKGRCISKCPNGLHYANYTRDCLPRVDCLMGSWSNWTECSRDGRTCGFKYGWRTRTLEIVQAPSRDGKQCPAITREEQQCLLARRRCPDERTLGAPSAELSAATGAELAAAAETTTGRRRRPPPSPDGDEDGRSGGASRERQKPKPSRPSTSSVTCNSGAPAAAASSDGRPSSDGRCHRVRHGKEPRSHDDATSTSVRPSARSTDRPPGTAVATLRKDAAAANSAPSAAATTPQPRVTDVKAAEYYNYYLTLSRQLQRHRGSMSAHPADGA